MRILTSKRYDATLARRRGVHALVAVLAFGVVACSENAFEPVAPGSILVKTATTGFLKAEGYGVIVDGVSTTTIGANDEVTVEGLDPGSYLVELADVPANCTVEGVLVPVESAATVEAALTIGCAYADPVPYTIRFSRDRPDLETEAITECSFGICPSGEQAWDLWASTSSATEGGSVIRQNETAGAEIAHVPGVALSELTEADYVAATFTTDPVDDPFNGRVILIRTDQGNVYALGNPSEDVFALTLTFEAALIDQP
jgi:hypothetical protein